MTFDFDFIRLSIAFLCGVLLSISGSLIQSVTRNAIAGPATLGHNAYAVLFILLSYVLGLVLELPISPELFSFLLFLVGTTLFYGVSKKKVEDIFSKEVSYLILLGLCFNLFVGALFSLVHFLFLSLNISFPSQLWFGNFRHGSEVELVIIAGFALLTWFLSSRLGKELRVLCFGPGIADTLQIPIHKVQRAAFFLSLLGIGVVVSFFGVFSFAGIIFPQLLRGTKFFRSNIALELKWGSLITGLIFSLMDLICYNFLFYGSEIPVGMLLAVFGSFGLMFILLKQSGSSKRF